MARSRTFASVQLRPGVRMLAIGFSALAIALAGCDSGTQEPEAPAPEAVEYSAPAAGNAAQTSPKAAPDRPSSGEVAEGFEAAIPSNFPSTVPVLPDATPILGQGGNVDGAERSGVQLSSNKPPSEVVAFYKDELAAGGWELGESPNEYSVVATNADSTVMLLAVPDPSGVTMIYMITEVGGR